MAAPPQPHPFLHEPLLYISGLPSYVSDSALAQAFESCVPFRPHIVRDGSDRPLSGSIEFRELDKAEKALATLQGRPVPGAAANVAIRLSPFPPDQQAPTPTPSASPRIVKQLPPGYTDSQLYDLFRPFGPLASVRTQTLFGTDTGVLEYWREEDAKVAEAEMHCAEVENQNIAVQIYHPRRAPGGPGEFSPVAPPFVPSGVPYPPHTGRGASHSPSPRRMSGPFVHGPGQQVQFAPLSGPGAGSHSGLIDPCNLFVKNIDETIDSGTLFQHFTQFGQIVSARVMRDESGRSRGFGFVSYQTPDQAALALHSMNGVVLGQKQIVVRLHEPKQLRQEKLAARFAGGHNNHPRSRSGATSPTASEGGDSHGWPSPHGGFQSLASPASGYSERLGPEQRARRGSGSYYNAALSGQLQMAMSYDELSAMSSVVRKEVLSGDLQRRVKSLNEVPESEVDGVVNALLGLSLAEVVDAIHDSSRFSAAVQNAQKSLKSAPESRDKSKERSRKSPSPAESADSRLLDPNVLAATASAPDHPSTPISHSSPLSTPPRTSSPASNAIPGGGGASERERLRAAVGRIEPDSDRAAAITELLMSLSKRERAMCLFNVEVLRGKVADAKLVLDSDDGDVEEPSAVTAPVTPARKSTASSALEDSPQTPALSSRAPSAAASPAAPLTPPSKSVTGTLSALPTSVDKLAQLPAAKIIEIVRDNSTAEALGLSKADPLIIKATDEFVDSLREMPVPKQKQQLGDKLFRVVKGFGIKGAPKVTIALLDQEELRPLAHLMNSYPPVLKEKALLAQAALSTSK
ncbi:uncharacterized protein FOMMEDRAFT_171180 [Fomitiporia mediterranea MF3/22]|uniref:uncharacterized protein n=1 Tax=Fomitiporia mediterranea (strain MF3/22) TaxID=694068 RepID=UPI00044074A8|nr:uncharacterized protein FOMMEDRAFT_171180 [Fomitiporia mediterranea MF3/22]EJC98246.1 hypothetical protein FOMMEDRAFT_171180 [Fomitiporia mediterranea MF3/22]